MQLVAYGAQDIYLTGNPQITFFKVVYRRHTNFAMESVAQTFSGSAGAGGRAVATVARNGDLVGRMYIEAENLSAVADDTATVNLGAVLIDNVKVEIGGQEIDKQTGAWMNAYAELTESNPTGSNTGITLFQKMAQMGGAGNVAKTGGGVRTFIPLQFWFNRNPGLALPLIALQYHEVKVTVQLSNSVDLDSKDVELWADYIYLDTDERRRFAQVSHEYLIEQVQHQNFSNGNNCDLTFNHPVKELVWTGAWTGGKHTGLTAAGKWNLKLNGHDRFAERDVQYFTRAQVWQHHTGHGSVSAADSIAVYSFALKPEEHQPSGTCNFSRIDNAQLRCSTQGASVDVYAVNYNVLRVMSGMGGLAYSN